MTNSNKKKHQLLILRFLHISSPETVVQPYIPPLLPNLELSLYISMNIVEIYRNYKILKNVLH